MRGTRGGLLALVFGLALLGLLAGKSAVAGPPPPVAYLDPIGAFSNPTYVTAPPDDATRLFVVEQGGTIQLFKNGTASLFMTVPGVTSGGERGLLSMAFPPDYAASGLFYVYYTHSRGRGDPNRRVPPRRIESGHRGSDVSSPCVDGPASGPVESQRRPAPVRAGRDALHRDRRRRQRKRPAEQRPAPECSAREAASYRSEAIRPERLHRAGQQPVRRPGGGPARNLVVRPPEPVAVLVRPCHARPQHRRRRARQLGGDRLPAGGHRQRSRRQLRLALPRREASHAGHHMQPASSEHGRSRMGIHALGRAAQRLLDLGRLRRPRPGGSRPPWALSLYRLLQRRDLLECPCAPRCDWGRGHGLDRQLPVDVRRGLLRSCLRGGAGERHQRLPHPAAGPAGAVLHPAVRPAGADGARRGRLHDRSEGPERTVAERRDAAPGRVHARARRQLDVPQLPSDRKFGLVRAASELCIGHLGHRARNLDGQLHDRRRPRDVPL